MILGQHYLRDAFKSASERNAILDQKRQLNRAINNGGKQLVDWAILNLDTQEEFTPQFPLRGGVEVSAGGNVVVQERYGFQDPIVQWTSGKGKTFRFNTRLYADSESEGLAVKQLMEQALKLSEFDKFLGRPPICQFTYVNALREETVVVESANPVIHDVLSNGDPRDVTIEFMLRKYVPFSQFPASANAPAKESFYLAATSAERSYEAIAKRYYGDPMLGDRLRKRHPESPFAPEIGEIIRVPSKVVIANEVVEPSSHILALDDRDALAAYQNILSERNSRQLVIVK